MAELAQRFKAGKIRFELIPQIIITAIATVMTKGTYKYDDDNWKLSIGTTDSASFRRDRLGSALRHIRCRRDGEEYDTEVVTGAEDLPTYHLAHAIVNLMFILFYDIMDGLCDLS